MKALFAALVLLSAAPAAHAAWTQYDCTFAAGQARDGNYVPTKMVLRHDEKTGRVIVFDPIIKHFAGNPIAAEVADGTAQRTSYTWTVEMRGLKGGNVGSATMDYRFSHFRNGRPAQMAAVPRGLSYRFTGEGTCRVTKG